MPETKEVATPQTEGRAKRARRGPKRLVIPAIVVAAAVGALALLVFSVADQTDHSSLDAKVASGHLPLLPDASMKLPALGSSSRRIPLDRFRGKVVVLNFFASWCTGCQAEAPLMAREQKILKSHGDTIVGVTYEDSARSTESFDQKYGVTWPVLRDPSGAFSRALGDYYVPETFILSPQGRIEALNRYEVSAKWLKTNVARALRAQRS